MHTNRRLSLALVSGLTALLVACAAHPAGAVMPPLHPDKGFLPAFKAPPFPIGMVSEPAGTSVSRIPGIGIGSGEFPTMGDARLLAILVQFNDVTMQAGARAAWTTHAQNFNMYFAAQSNGLYNPTITLTANTYTLNHSMAYYGLPDSSTNAENLLQDAMDAAAGAVNFGDYHGIMVIHAGDGDESMQAGDTEAIYSRYTWNPVSPLGQVTQGAVTHKVYGFTIVPEKEAQGSPYGVFLHEFGHQIGLDDFYDTRSSGAYVGSVGGWCLMAHGGWGFPEGTSTYGSTPGALMPYNRIKLGWLQPMTMIGNFFDEERFAHAPSDVYKVWKDGVPGSEYFLFEARAMVPTANFTPGWLEGLLVWRVQETIADNSRDWSGGVRVELIQADGYGNMNLLENFANWSNAGAPGKCNRGDGGDIYPGTRSITSLTKSTTPNSRSWAGADTLVAARNIATAGSGTGLVVNYDVYIKKAIAKVSGDAQTGPVGSPLSAPLVVRVRDGADAVASGVTLNFSVKTGTGSLSAASAITDANGLAQVTYTPNSAGEHEIEVTSLDAAGPGFSGAAVFRCTATGAGQTVDAAKSDLTVSPSTLPADGTSKTTITVTVRDTTNAPIAGAAVAVTLTDGGYTMGPLSATADAQGVATLQIGTTRAAVYSVSATANGVQINAVRQVTFTSTGQAVSAANSTVTATPASVAANGTSVTTITVVALDALNEVVPGATVTLSATGTGNTITPAQGTTNAQGVVTFTVASTVAEGKTLSATAGGVLINQTAAVTFTAVGPAVSAANSTVTASPASVVADGTSAATVTVTVRDGANGAIAGVAVSVSASGTGNAISPAEATSDSQGRATFTLRSTAAGAKTVSAVAGGVALAQTATVTFTSTGQDISAANSTVAVSPASLPADGASVATVTVTVRDSANAAVSGAVASIAVTGVNTVSPATAVTAADGRATFTVTSSEAGAKSVSASAGGVSIAQTATLTFTAVARVVSATLSAATAEPASVLADGVAEATVRVTVRDTLNALYSGVAVTLSVGGTGNTVTPAQAVTGADGVATLKVKSTVAGTKEIAVTAGGVTLAARPAVLFTPKPRFVSTDLSTVTLTPSTVYADGLQYATITVTVRDTENAPYAGRTVTVAASGGGNAIDPAQTATDAQGKAIFRLRSTEVGSKIVSASADGVILAQKPAVTFVVEGVSAVKSTVVATPLTGARANGIDFVTVTITVVNVQDKFVQGTIPVIAVGGTGYTLTPSPAAATDSNGRTVVLLRSTRAEAKNLRVTVGGVLLADSPTVSFSPGPAVRMEAVAATNNQTGTVGSPAPSPLKVRVYDVNDNPAPGAQVSFAFTERPAGETGGAVATPVTTDANGEAASALVFGARAGRYRVEAASSGLAGSPLAFTATAAAGPPAALAKEAGGDGQSASVFATLPQPLSVSVKDALGNPRAGVAVNWSVAAAPIGSTGTTVSPANAVTDANGVARVNVTLGGRTGLHTIRAESAGLAGSPADFTATAVAGPARRMELVSGGDQSGAAGALLAEPVKVRVIDSGGNAVAGVAVSFRSAAGGGAFVEGNPRTTDASGIAQATFRLPETAGAVSIAIEASVPEGGVLSVGAVARAGAASALLAISGGASGTVGGFLSAPVVAKVTDSFGNAIQGHSVAFALVTVPAGSAGHLVETPVAVTGADGLASTRIRLGDKAGACLATASAAGLSGSPASFPFAALPGAADPLRSSFAIQAPVPLVADGVAKAAVQVTALDAYGNPVAGLPPGEIQVYTTMTGDRIEAPSAATDASGRATAYVLATRIGERTVRARIGGVTLAQATALLFSPGPPDPARCGISATPQGNIPVAGGSALVIVTLLDKFLNPVTGYDGARVALAAEGTGVALVQPVGPADGEGRVFGSASCTEAGFRVVRATVDGTPLPETLTLSFVTKPIDAARTSFLRVSGENVVADGNAAYVMKLRVVDTDNLPVAGVPVEAVEVRDDEGGELFGTARALTDAQGETLVDVRSRVAGVRSARPWISGVRMDAVATLAFAPGAAVSLAAAGDAVRPGMAGAASADGFVVRALDAHGNGVANVQVEFSVIAPAGAAGYAIAPGLASTGADGASTALFTAGDLAGVWLVRAASAGLQGSPVTFTVNVAPAAVASFRVTVPDLSLASGEPLDGVTVEAFDRFGNAKTDYLGSVWFESGDPAATLPYLATRRYAFRASDAGRALFDGFLFLSPGTWPLTVRDAAASGVSLPIVVTDAGAGLLAVSPFHLPGDPASFAVVVKPAVGLTRAPEARFVTASGVAVTLPLAAMRNNVYFATGRMPDGSRAAGTIYATGRRAGTAEFVSGRAAIQ